MAFLIPIFYPLSNIRLKRREWMGMNGNEYPNM